MWLQSQGSEINVASCYTKLEIIIIKKGFLSSFEDLGWLNSVNRIQHEYIYEFFHCRPFYS